MKKILFLCAIIISSSILSSCSPIVQGAAAVTTVATMNNDRRTMGEILDDKTLYMDLGNMVNKDPMLEDAHVNFNIYNQAVLITVKLQLKTQKSTLKALSKANLQKLNSSSMKLR